MTFQWDPSLETGHEKIDNQHKQLFSTLNNLIEASKKGKDKEEVFKVMDFLTGYVIMHFKTEEDLQLKYNYPDYDVHKQYHNGFITTVDNLTKQLIEQGPTEQLIKNITMAISSWLINHIKGDDFRMATFVKQKDLEESGGK